MGILGRKETERRLRVMARSMVDMERGIYPWPDGRKPLRPNGTPVISKAEVARSAGYSGTSNARNMETWFEDPYYLRELEKERARREVNMAEIVQFEENLPLAIAHGLFAELLVRLEHDPASISTNNILTFAPQLHKYGLELAVKMGAAGEEKVIEAKVDRFNQHVGATVFEMNPTERAGLVASTQEASEARMAAVRAAVAKANVQEERDDDRGEQPLTADGTVSS